MTRLKIHTWYNTCTCIHQLWIYKIPLTYRLIWLVLIYLRVIFNIQHQSAVVREKKKAQGKVPVLYNHKQASMIQLELILCKHKDNYVNLTVVFAYIYRCSKIQVHSCYYVGKVKKTNHATDQDDKFFFHNSLTHHMYIHFVISANLECTNWLCQLERINA